MNKPSPEARQALAQWKRRSPKPLSAIQRYGLAVLSVSLALGAALLMNRFPVRDVEVPIFLFAVAVTAWYGGAGAAVLALLLSCISFDYFFVQPFHTLNITTSELPYFITFASFASLIAWFGAVRRRAEAELREARDKLEIEVAERTQQASLLNLTHDTIFVHDMSKVIVFWNRGAQGLNHTEAATVVGVSEKTVQGRLNQARLLLAEKLADLRPVSSCESKSPADDTPSS